MRANPSAFGTSGCVTCSRLVLANHAVRPGLPRLPLPHDRDGALSHSARNRKPRPCAWAQCFLGAPKQRRLRASNEEAKDWRLMVWTTMSVRWHQLPTTFIAEIHDASRPHLVRRAQLILDKF